MRLCIKTRKKPSGLSLVELIVVVAILGVIAVFALPSIKNVLEAGEKAKDIQNAKNLASISSKLAGLGVAHVLPESLGGIEATARMLSLGVVVPEGPMSGQKFQLSGVKDEEIEKMTPYLDISYDEDELSLVFLGATK